MTNSAWASSRLNYFRHDPAFETELAILDLTDLIVERMSALGANKADVARALGVSKAYVTKLLAGNHNMTIATLIRVANILGVRVTFNFLPRHVAELLESDGEYLPFEQSNGGMLKLEGIGEGEQEPLAA